MSALLGLWLPILLSAILVFFVSSLIHMVTPWHKADMLPVANQSAVMAALRPFGLKPGDYLMPRPESTAQMRSAEFKALHREGPVMLFTVLPSGQMGIGRQLVGWLLYTIAISVFAGYLALTALPPGAAYLRVFQVTGTAAFLGYSGALWQASIWFRRSWGTTLRSTLDGLLFALLTAGMFGWLWPR